MKTPSFHYGQLRKAYKHYSSHPTVKNKRTASYFVLTFTFFTLSFFGIFAIKPTLTTAASLIKSVSDLKKLKTDYEDKINSLVRAQSEYEKIRNDIPIINEAAPENSGISQLASALERFAARENVSLIQIAIDSVPVSTPAGTSKLESYGFTVIGNGGYTSLSSFISHLINWKRLLTIKSLDFTQEGASPSGILRLTLKGLAYYEP